MALFTGLATLPIPHTPLAAEVGTSWIRGGIGKEAKVKTLCRVFFILTTASTLLTVSDVASMAEITGNEEEEGALPSCTRCL